VGGRSGISQREILSFIESLRRVYFTVAALFP
jgi:hypothetical protein